MPTKFASFISIDVETAARSPARICAIGAARFENGRETATFHSLVHTHRPIHYTHIHGLSAADLSDAPPWPIVWRSLQNFLGDTHTLVGYRVGFDRAALLTMCARYGLRLPRFQFVCAAEVFRKTFRRSPDLATALKDIGLPFPGRPHDPLADARAAALLLFSLLQRDNE